MSTCARLWMKYKIYVSICNSSLEVVTVIADSCLGGSAGTRGFIGCMKMIRVNSIYKAPTDWKLYEVRLNLFLVTIFKST